MEATEAELFRAIEARDAKRVKALIVDQDADADALDEDGRSALRVAVDAGDLDVLDVLLSDGGADPDAPDDDGESGLWAALRSGRADMVKAMLEAGADYDALSADELSGLRFAARAGQAELVRMLLEQGANPRLDPGPPSVVREVAAAGRLEVLRVLVAHAEDICVRELHQAVCDGDLQTIDALLSAGLPIDARHDAEDAWVGAHPDGQRDRDRFDEQTALHLAAVLGRADVIELLAARGADIDARQSVGSGRTALHKAAAAGHVEAVRALVAAGADLDAVDSWNETPLCKATRLAVAAGEKDGAPRAGHLAAIEHLLAAGAGFQFGYLGERHMFEEMPPKVLRFVAEQQWKVDRGARVRSETSRPLLGWAVRLRDLETTRALLDLGAEPAATCVRGWTALHEAVEAASPALVRCLLDRGAPADARDLEGRTPRDIAERVPTADTWAAERAEIRALLDARS